MSHKDKRLKIFSEILQGIKAIKFSAWEDAFAEKVNDIRREEVKCLKVKIKCQ